MNNSNTKYNSFTGPFVTPYEEIPVSDITTFYDTFTPTLYEAKTFYTTYTFFTTLFAGTEPVVSSSEQIISNVVTVPVTTQGPQTSSVVPEVIGPVTVFDTSETVITKTHYNTVTFYATLFSDTSSFVTPIEEVQTDIRTATETFTITRTILPTPSASFVPLVTETIPISDVTRFIPDLEPSVVVTRTLYTTFTNFVTLFQGTDTTVTNLEEIVTNVVTMTVPAHAASSFTEESAPSSTKDSMQIMSITSTPVYTTREVVSTQTHYLTLFNSDQSLLSSITELVTSYVTELVSPLTPSLQSYSYVPESRVTSSPGSYLLSSEVILPSSEIYTPFTTTSETIEETTSEISTYHPELVPSIKTIYSTLTFYTTYYSDTSSIVASQEEVLTSYVTLFVPPSLITSTAVTTTEQISPTSTIDPSVFVFTTTDYSTLTLYTTLFSGDEIVVISSEHVVPEVITATITPSSTTLAETPTKDESILTFLTTFTYYTTYFSGIDPVIASSESVVTQFVTIEAPPIVSSSIEPSIESTPVEETIIGVSTASMENIASSFSDLSSDIEIIGVSSAVATGLEIGSSIETKIQVESKIHSEVRFTPLLSSPVLSVTDISDSFTVSVEAKSTHEKESSVIVPSYQSDVSTTKIQNISVSTHMLSVSEGIPLPATTTSILTEKTEIVGLDGVVTSLAPSDTLVMVTGTDGFVTKLAETSTAVLSPVYVPATEQISSTTTSEIKPATVIELSDLLGGNTALGGDIGLSIKDIVSLITGKKNKTEDSVATEKTSDTANEDSFTTETSKSVDVTTENSFEKVTSDSPIESSKGDTEKEVAAPKDLDYPIFVLPSKEKDAKSELLGPVYVPEETIRTVQPKTMTTTETSKSKTFETSLSKVSKSVSTSIITGARTVFILPTKATSVINDSKDKYTIDTNFSMHDVTKDSSSQATKDFDITTKSLTPVHIPKENETPSDFISKHKVSSEISKSILSSQPEFKIETAIISSMSSPSKDDSVTITPELKPSIGTSTSVISGIRTVFFDPFLNKSPKSQTSSVVSSEKEEISGRANAEISTTKSFTTVTVGGQTVISRTTSGATTIFFPGQIPKYTRPVISTRYVTSVESITRTLALTTTRTYYTRDSTLTVPSVYTTTIPPRTFVSTIIGSRTILGILPEPSETVQIHKTMQPSERTTTVTTTTLIFNSIPSTVIRTLVLPTGVPTKSARSESSSSYADSSVFNAGTEKPARPPEVADSTAVTKEHSDVKESDVKPVQKVRDETYLRAANPRIHDDHPDMNFHEEVRRPPIVVTEAIRPEDDPFLNGRNGVCDPKCQPYKKEICTEQDGLWTCECRPGHARRDEHEICKGKSVTNILILFVYKILI